jgi:RNA polymerase sigma-70 factor (ECF subfamily)
LEHWRLYLLRIANDELDPLLRAKVGASDIVQETLVRAHERMAEFHGGDDVALKAWLRQILLHQLADSVARFHEAEKRSLSKEVSLDTTSSSRLRGSLIAGGPSPSEAMMAAEQAAAVEAAIARLSDDHQQVIHLRNRDRLSFAEIGGRLNRSADAARLLWYRALRSLERELHADTP